MTGSQEHKEPTITVGSVAGVEYFQKSATSPAYPTYQSSQEHPHPSNPLFPSHQTQSQQPRPPPPHYHHWPLKAGSFSSSCSWAGWIGTSSGGGPCGWWDCCCTWSCWWRWAAALRARGRTRCQRPAGRWSSAGGQNTVSTAQWRGDRQKHTEHAYCFVLFFINEVLQRMFDVLLYTDNHV